jgi:hypothetical protein
MTNEVETANFINNQNRNPGRFGNTYNPDFRKHPNFSWKDQNNTQQNFNFNQRIGGVPPQGNYQVGGSGKSGLEETIIRLFNDLSKKHDERLMQHEAELRLHNASLQNLEKKWFRLLRQSLRDHHAHSQAIQGQTQKPKSMQ